MNDLVVLAHGPLGPLDEVLPLAVSMAVLLGWSARAAFVEAQSRWRLRRVSLRIRGPWSR